MPARPVCWTGGASIEDSTGQEDAAGIYDRDVATARVAAAAEVAHGSDVRLVLTARCENYMHGHPDLADTIARLQSYGAAGARAKATEAAFASSR